VVYVSNRLPIKILGGHTPFKSMMGKDAKLGHLKEIRGLVVFCCVNNKGEQSLRVKKSYLMGYGEKTIGYCAYDPIANTVINTRN
jgi:hypothetical protein